MKKSSVIASIILISMAIVCTSNFVHADNVITRVQGPAQGTLSGNSITVTLLQTPQSGDVLIAVMGLEVTDSNQPQVAPQITQTGVNWPCLSHSFVSTGSTSGSGIEVWWGIVNSATASRTITIDLSHFSQGSGSVTCATVNVCEYSGIDTSYITQSPYVDQTIDNKGTGTAIDTSNNGLFNDPVPTTVYADELWVGGALLNGASQSTPTYGFTLVNDGAVYNGISVSYLENIVSSVGQVESGTTGASRGAWLITLATFPAATSNFVLPESSIGALSAIIAFAASFAIWKKSKKPRI